MELSILFDHRFYRTPAQTIYSPTLYNYGFFQKRYLSVFDSVRIIARVEDVISASGDEHQATEGRGVRVVDLGDWSGAGGFVKSRQAVLRATEELMDRRAACLMIVPGGIPAIAWRSLARRGYPYVLEVVGDPWQAYGPGAVRHRLRPVLRRWFSRGLRRQCELADAVLYVTRNALQERYPSRGLSAGISDVVLSPQAFASGARTFSEGPLTIIHVGTMSQLYKGHGVLIDAVRMCISDGLDIRLVLAGDGKHRPELEEKVRRSGISERVRFAGHLCSASAVRSELDAADVFVLSSLTEGLPRAMVEAMARGLPCIGTRVGGVPELLDRDDLVEPRDVRALAERIRDVVSDHGRMARMSVRNLERSLAYQEPNLVSRRTAFYRDVRKILEKKLPQSSPAQAADPVLLHITTVPQTLGFIVRQMLYMRREGWKVHTIASPGRHETVVRSQGIPFYPIEMLRRISPFRDLGAIARLCLTIRRIGPTVVHAHTPKAGLLGMIAAKLCGVPVQVFHVHGLPHLTATGARRRLLILATRVACRLAHRVYCVSPSMRRILIDQKLCLEAKVTVPMNGSSGGVEALDKFNPSKISARTVAAMRSDYGVPADSLVAGFVGRLVRDKGLIELSGAWKLLRSAYPDLYLVIAGEFEPQDPIPADVVEAFRTDPRVRLVGHCSNIPAFLAAVDLVVFPSYREGFPNVPLEAAAMEVPVVATRIPGCVDAILDQVTGTLVPPYDMVALARAVERYIQEPELRRLHGGSGREHAVRNYRPEPIWEFIANEYNTLLLRRGLCAPGRDRSNDTQDEREPCAT